MSVPFNPQHGLVMVRAAVDGPSGSAVFRLALDTGATGTVINVGMLVALGYDPALAPARIQVTTGSGVEFVPRIPLNKIVTLGHERTNFPVLGHTLPPSAGIDGLLGLDFFRGQSLTVDFGSEVRSCFLLVSTCFDCFHGLWLVLSEWSLMAPSTL